MMDKPSNIIENERGIIALTQKNPEETFIRP